MIATVATPPLPPATDGVHRGPPATSRPDSAVAAAVRALAGAIRDRARGQPLLLHVAGPSGAGKTRALRALRTALSPAPDPARRGPGAAAAHAGGVALVGFASEDLDPWPEPPGLAAAAGSVDVLLLDAPDLHVGRRGDLRGVWAALEARGGVLCAATQDWRDLSDWLLPGVTPSLVVRLAAGALAV